MSQYILFCWGGRPEALLAEGPPPSASTLAELRKSQGDASQRTPRCYQAIRFACADPLKDLHLMIQQDDRSSDHAEVVGGHGGRGSR
jgi:hypothetical protein